MGREHGGVPDRVRRTARARHRVGRSQIRPLPDHPGHGRGQFRPVPHPGSDVRGPVPCEPDRWVDEESTKAGASPPTPSGVGTNVAIGAYWSVVRFSSSQLTARVALGTTATAGANTAPFGALATTTGLPQVADSIGAESIMIRPAAGLPEVWLAHATYTIRLDASIARVEGSPPIEAGIVEGGTRPSARSVGGEKTVPPSVDHVVRREPAESHRRSTYPGAAAVVAIERLVAVWTAITTGGAGPVDVTFVSSTSVVPNPATTKATRTAPPVGSTAIAGSNARVPIPWGDTGIGSLQDEEPGADSER